MAARGDKRLATAHTYRAVTTLGPELRGIEMRARTTLAERQRAEHLAARHFLQQPRRGRLRRHRRPSPRSRCASGTPSRSKHTPRRPPHTHQPAPPTRRPHHPAHTAPTAPARRPGQRAQLLIGKPRLTVDLSGARRDQRLRQLANLREHAIDVAHSNFCHLPAPFRKRTRGPFATPTGRPRRQSLSEASSRHPLSTIRAEADPAYELLERRLADDRAISESLPVRGTRRYRGR